jgi:hypothetical protein
LALPDSSLVDVRDASESDFSVLSVSPVVDVANEVDFSVLSVCSVVDV